MDGRKEKGRAEAKEEKQGLEVGNEPRTRFALRALPPARQLASSDGRPPRL